MGSSESKQQVVQHDIDSMKGDCVHLQIDVEKTLYDPNGNITKYPYFVLRHLINSDDRINKLEHLGNHEDRLLWDFLISCSSVDNKNVEIKCDGNTVDKDCRETGILENLEITTEKQKIPGYIWGYYIYHVTKVYIKINEKEYNIKLNSLAYRYIDYMPGPHSKKHSSYHPVGDIVSMY